RITKSRTRNYPLLGAAGESTSVELLAANYEMPMSTIRHLTEKFGERRVLILNLIRENASLASPIIEGMPHIQAEILYAVREESAVYVEDILSRRLGLQFYDWRLAAHAAPIVAAIAAKELGWSPEQTRSELNAYAARINRCLVAIGQERICVKQTHRGNINDEIHPR